MLYGEVNRIQFAVANPKKEADLRLPTPEEMLDRLRVQRSVRRELGRRRTKTDFVRNPEADLALFNKLRVDENGEQFDEFEAEHCIGVLTSCDVTDSERVGDQYKITLHWKQFGDLEGDTVHYLRIPTMKQLKLYQRGIVSAVDLPHNQTEIRYNISAACDLYSDLFVKSEGYAADVNVPPHHMSAVITELSQCVQNPEAGEDPAGF